MIKGRRTAIYHVRWNLFFSCLFLSFLKLVGTALDDTDAPSATAPAPAMNVALSSQSAPAFPILGHNAPAISHATGLGSTSNIEFVSFEGAQSQRMSLAKHKRSRVDSIAETTTSRLKRGKKAISKNNISRTGDKNTASKAPYSMHELFTKWPLEHIYVVAARKGLRSAIFTGAVCGFQVEESQNSSAQKLYRIARQYTQVEGSHADKTGISRSKVF